MPNLGRAVRDALTPSQRVLMVKNDEEKDKAIAHWHRSPSGLCSRVSRLTTTRRWNCWRERRFRWRERASDIIAPSDMMDGRVARDPWRARQAGFTNTPILSYAAKFASGYYGPFREAADSAPQFGDRRSYQMDGANFREAMREIELDIEEGADMIMVKPAMPYLDVIAAARERFDLPLAAYQVSGEYAMIEAAARNDWIDRERVMMESLVSIRRAGASTILTYYAKDAARLLG